MVALKDIKTEAEALAYFENKYPPAAVEKRMALCKEVNPSAAPVKKEEKKVEDKADEE